MKSNTGKYLKIAALVWSGCFVVFLLIFVLVLYPLNKQRNRVENEYSKLKADADAAFIASQEQTKQKFMELVKETNDRLGNFMIEADRNSNISHEIIQLSNKIGLNIEVIPAAQRNSAFDECECLTGQYFQVNFTAGYDKFAKFLNELERYRPVIFIDTFSIKKARQDETKPAISMNLAVLVAKNGTKKKTEG
jgi:hypothetical protein